MLALGFEDDLCGGLIEPRIREGEYDTQIEDIHSLLGCDLLNTKALREQTVEDAAGSPVEWARFRIKGRNMDVPLSINILFEVGIIVIDNDGSLGSRGSFLPVLKTLLSLFEHLDHKM